MSWTRRDPIYRAREEAPMDESPRSLPVRRRTLLAAAGAAVAAAGAGATRAAAAPHTGTVKRRKVPPPPPSNPQPAGQRVIFSFPGLTPPSSLLSAISAGQCAGVIFFG